MRRRLSLRTRLVLGVLALALVALIGADVATYKSLESFLFDRTDSSLQASHHVVENALGRDEDFRTLLAAAPGLYIQVRSTDNRILFSGGVPQLGRRESPPAPPKLPETISLDHARQEGPDRARYFDVHATSGGDRYRVRAAFEPPLNAVLIVATSLSDVDGTLHRLFLIELLVTAVALGAIALLGLWIVRLGLRPLAAIGRTADAIAAGDLSRRVERAEPRTEVGRLGLALNAMLARIEASDRRLRQFVSDASHELRTPLAAVRAYAELFDRGAADRPDDLTRAMSGIGRESERMSALVDDLLLLARLDEKRPLERQPLDLDEVATEAVEAARAVEPERPVELVVEPLVVVGDRERLRQVVDNLLANVRAHTPAGTAVRVRVAPRDGTAVLEVEDEGPGLSLEEAEHVFERFYRVDESRARASGGVGLGLAIVAAVAEAHGGSVAVRADPGSGATFTVTLPLAEKGDRP